MFKKPTGKKILMDPAVFNHPLALQTEWTPCIRAGQVIVLII